MLNRGQRSLLAQFRSGILPLKIETGRYQNIPPEFRLCIMCDRDVIEDESHFMFHCQLYDNIRQKLYGKIEDIYPGFQNCADCEKLKITMNEEIVKFTATYIWEAFSKRRAILYK